MGASFNRAGLEKLKAMVHPENVASIRLLTKFGFIAERQDVLMGMETILFSLSAIDAQSAEHCGQT